MYQNKVKTRASAFQVVVGLSLLLITPVVVSDYFSAQEELSQAKAHALVNGVEASL